MPEVRFNLKNRQEKETLISAIFRYDGKRLVYSTGQKINPNLWNNKEHKVRETAKYPGYPEFNAYLKKIANTILDIYRRSMNDSKQLSIAEFKTELDIALERVIKPESESLIGFVERFIYKREHQLARPKSSIKVYNKTLNLLKDFAAKKRRKIDFQDIDLNFLSEFIAFTQAPPRSLSINYIAKIIQHLKTFLNEASEEGINTNFTYRSRKFKIASEETENIYLSIDELNILYQLDLSDNQRLEKVRDLFLIGCYTGLRFSDFTNLRKEHFKHKDGVDVIEVIMQKTKSKVIIPIKPIVKEILNKYNGKTPPEISNQKMNAYLKEVGELAGISETITKMRTKGGKRVDEVFPKYELISTHTARRSFATNAFKAGIPTLSIMKITGHQTESSFMKYIKLSREENAILMAKNPFFNS